MLLNQDSGPIAGRYDAVTLDIVGRRGRKVQTPIVFVAAKKLQTTVCLRGSSGDGTIDQRRRATTSLWLGLPVAAGGISA